MKIYIAGSITNNPNYKFEFAAAEKSLIKFGHEVINPVTDEELDYKGYIDLGLNKLMKCDAIYMLKNWQKSKGACLERKYALAVEMKVLYEVQPSYKKKERK